MIFSRAHGRRSKLVGVLLTTVVAIVAVPAVASAISAAGPGGMVRTGSPAAMANPFFAALGARAGVTALGGSPGNPITNPKTHTLYVALQCRQPAPGACSHPRHVLDVIDSDKCKPGHTCQVVAKAQAGKVPLSEAIDQRTDTIYVGDGAGTVTVVNGARCNAAVTSGCAKPLATIKTGGSLVAMAFNPKTHTVYAANLGSHSSVFVLDVATCNAATTKGCGRPVKEVKDPLGPDGLAVAVATNTIYAANSGPNGNGNTVSLINGAKCNGSNGSGCGQTPHAVKVGANPFWDVVDQATNTVYIANHNDGTVSVIDGVKCNAKVTSGCHRIPAAPTGAGVAFLAVDHARHTVFALNQDDGTLSAINTKACNGKVISGCRRRAPNERADFNPPYGYNPNAFTLTPRGTAYLVNGGGEPFLGVISVNRCSAENTSGCRVEAPTARNQESLMSVDRSTHTIYAGNVNHPRIDVLNAATCRAGHLAGCAPVGEIPMPDPRTQIGVGSIDDSTHTLYAADAFGNTVAAVNLAHCRVGDTSGCGSASPKITVGKFPGQPVLDRATHTLYVPNGAPGNRVGVLNAATCNATNASGCGQTPAQVPVAKGSFVIALSAAKNTVYAANSGFGAPQLLHTVAVINGATCNATNHSGCDHPAATVKVGLAPFGVAVNDRTHTLYVANNKNGDLPGTVSLIDTDTCNGSHTGGCAGRKPTARVGRSPLGIAIDALNNSIYIADFSSAAVSVLNGAKCSAGRTSGCAHGVHEQPVGSQPVQPAVNPATHSVFQSNGLAPGSLSIFKTST